MNASWINQLFEIPADYRLCTPSKIEHHRQDWGYDSLCCDLLDHTGHHAGYIRLWETARAVGGERIDDTGHVVERRILTHREQERLHLI